MNRHFFKQALVIICILAGGYFNTQAQEHHDGIVFDDMSSWKEVLARAKKEGKSIFVDCYASWCGPCKLMEKNIFPQKRIGDFFNENFISIRLQMDTSKNDEPRIKRMYGDANSFFQLDKIFVYPTFLFFNNEGSLVHKVAGAYNESAFLEVGKDALNPRAQFYMLLKRYNDKTIDTGSLIKLIKITKMLSLRSDAEKMAEYYFKITRNSNITNQSELELLQSFPNGPYARKAANKYVRSLPKDSLFILKNVTTISSFILSSNDYVFKIFYENQRRIDSAMKKPGFAASIICDVIKKEVVDRFGWPDGKVGKVEPDWNVLQNHIAKKYDDSIADRVIANSQMAWYGGNGLWHQYTRSVVRVIERYGKNLPTYIKNNFSMAIFIHSDVKSELEIAANWVNPDYTKDYKNTFQMDTYANLLYKLGRKTEAIQWQEKAQELNPKDNEISENLNKMKNGVPTWQQN